MTFASKNSYIVHEYAKLNDRNSQNIQERQRKELQGLSSVAMRFVGKRSLKFQGTSTFLAFGFEGAPFCVVRILLLIFYLKRSLWDPVKAWWLHPAASAGDGVQVSSIHPIVVCQHVDPPNGIIYVLF